MNLESVGRRQANGQHVVCPLEGQVEDLRKLRGSETTAAPCEPSPRRGGPVPISAAACLAVPAGAGTHSGAPMLVKCREADALRERGRDIRVASLTAKASVHLVAGGGTAYARLLQALRTSDREGLATPGLSAVRVAESEGPWRPPRLGTGEATGETVRHSCETWSLRKSTRFHGWT